jgi:hypothetical protein
MIARTLVFICSTGSPFKSNTLSTMSTSTCHDRKRSIHSTNQTPYRSAVDYDTEEDLREAMLFFIRDVDDENGGSGVDCSTQLTALLDDIRDGHPVQKVARTTELLAELGAGYDWVLPKFDQENTLPLTVQDEMKRLTVLKSYMIVDSKREEAFDLITQFAARTFDAPLAMISFVDLGRAFMVSTHGGEKFGWQDLINVPRDFSLCSRKYYFSWISRKIESLCYTNVGCLSRFINLLNISCFLFFSRCHYEQR